MSAPGKNYGLKDAGERAPEQPAPAQDKDPYDARCSMCGRENGSYLYTRAEAATVKPLPRCIACGGWVVLERGIRPHSADDPAHLGSRRPAAA